MVRPCLASVAALVAHGPAVPAAAATSNLELAVLREVNHARVVRHRGRLRSHAGLARAAARHSRAMAQTGRLAHSPDWAGPLRRVTPSARLWAQNLAWVPAGAASQVARQTIRSWLHSPPHRRNLLMPRIDVAGLGAASGGGGVYVTAD